MYNTVMSFMGILVNAGIAFYYLTAGYLWFVEYNVVLGSIFFLLGYVTSTAMFDWSLVKEA